MPILTEAERVGTTLDGRYALRSVLGRGGMGVVFAAEHVLTGRSVAVKLVRPELADDPRYAERLFREARAAASLQHPNVVDVLDMGTLEDGGLYLVLERLEGRDLANLLEEDGPLSVARTLALIDPVLDALQALHDKGIVHRDLKPSNVFVTRRGEVEVPKLLDFGIAKLRDGQSGTTTGRILGTPWYMSPEQAAGDIDAGPAADVWAVGAMLFECLSGRVPFDGPTPTAVLMNVLRYDAPVLDLPATPHVVDAVRRAMSKGDDRLRSAAELRAALHGEAKPSSAVRSASPSNVAAKPAPTTPEGGPITTANGETVLAVPNGETVLAVPSGETVLAVPNGETVLAVPRRDVRWVVGLALVVVVAAGGAAWGRFRSAFDVPISATSTTPPSVRLEASSSASAAQVDADAAAGETTRESARGERREDGRSDSASALGNERGGGDVRGGGVRGDDVRGDDVRGDDVRGDDVPGDVGHPNARPVLSRTEARDRRPPRPSRVANERSSSPEESRNPSAAIVDEVDLTTSEASREPAERPRSSEAPALRTRW